MNTSGQIMRSTVVLVALGAFFAVSPSRGQKSLEGSKSVVFNGLPHTATGAASLKPALVIRGLGSSGEDGVSVEVGKGVRHWTATMRGVPSTLDFDTTLTILGREADGSPRTLSSLEMKELALSDGYALAFSPTFDSATYRLEVFHGSKTVLDISGLRTGTGVLSGNDSICEAFGKANSVALGICEWVVSDCHTLDDDGRSVWTIDRVAPVTWEVPATGSSVVGDRIRLTAEERPRDPAKTFTDVWIRASNLSELTILEESALSTLTH